MDRSGLTIVTPAVHVDGIEVMRVAAGEAEGAAAGTAAEAEAVAAESAAAETGAADGAGPAAPAENAVAGMPRAAVAPTRSAASAPLRPERVGVLREVT